MIAKPNIIWLTLDSLRQDHTTMGSYDRETTPNIQSIADGSDGIAFSSCFSHSRASATSIPSILSGTYPSRHGTYYADRSGFPDELPLVAELLQDVGYHTAAVSNNAYASELTGLERGFDDFTLLGTTPFDLLKSAGVRSVAKYIANIRRHSVGFETDLHAHSAAYLVNEVTERRIRSASEPVFLYVHYNETHRGFYPPLPYLDRFTDGLDISPREAASIAMDIHHNLVEIVANGCELSETELAALEAMYDGEIAYTDDRVGALYETIQTLLGETIIVITADHGELFGEESMLAHKYSMHNAVLNVPMVVQGIEGLTDEGPIQHSDVIRTLLEVAGARTETIQGVDLREEQREFAISQSPPGTLDPLLEHNASYDKTKFPTEPYSVCQNGQFKYIDRSDGPHLYRLPDETTNVASEHPDAVEQIGDFLSYWLETEGERIGSGQEITLDGKTQSRLADLGYLDHEM
ncbi:sulfatase [Halovivax cerinus]|uniref:Sulfatase n=1 Tax=Halovivax cerinus TaxID=1487865 RepID=A0ABD5NJ49_9EURY|nr:sulfatase [Halovivax cerinus]